MPAEVLISSGTAFKADTVTITGVTSISGPAGERKVIDQTALEDTVTFQATSILSFAKGITFSGGATTATMKTLNDALVADSTIAVTKVLSGKTASGTMKVTMLETTAQVQDKVSFNATFVPTGSVTIQN